MGKQGLFSFMFVFILTTLLTGCGTMSPGVSTNVEQCELPTSIPNVYDVPPEEWITRTYEHIAVTGSMDNEELYRQTRYAAFQLLRRQTERWSNNVDIVVSETEKIRITVTYISPQLLQTIELNRLLHARSNPILTNPDFNSKVKTSMERAIKLKSLIFLVTITSSSSSLNSGLSPITLDIPVTKMVLSNAGKTDAFPIYYDDSLEEYIRLQDGYFSGFVDYQMTIKNDDTCNLYLDDVPDRKITIYVPELYINDKKYEKFTWTIRYSSLLTDEIPSEVPNFYPPDTWLGYETCKPEGKAPNSDLQSDAYWEKLGLYLWEQVTFANSP